MQTLQEAARERQLFEAFVHGDDAAFSMLFQCYHDRLVRDACRYVSEEVAQDIVQEIFARLWLYRSRWAIRTTVRNYLHTAVRNRARDVLARFNTERRATDAYRLVLESRLAVNADELLLAEELEQAIQAGLETCSARSRAALLLLAKHTYYVDIARELGVQPGTVKVLVKRGRRRLRAYLRAHGWDDLVHDRRSAAALRLRLAATRILGITRRRSYQHQGQARQSHRHTLLHHETDVPLETNSSVPCACHPNGSRL